MKSTETGSSSSMVSKNVVVIGFDLGTTYSSVGVWIGEELRIGNIPSCIAFTDYAEEPVVGDEALVGVDKNPSNTILDVKRLIGVNFSDNRTKQDLLSNSFEVIDDPISKNDKPNIIVRSLDGWKRLFAEELLCMILKKLKQIAEEGLGLKNGDVIVNSVISVPSCYNNAQRLATKRAATMAGFGDSRDTHLGGKNFDDLLYRHCHRIHFNNPSERLRSKSSLRFACENAKKDLSNPNVTETKVSVHFYHVQSPKEFLLARFSVTQHVFDTECEELFDKCQEAIAQCLQVSGISQFHQVILVGGSTRIPRIRDMLRVFCREAQGFCEILEPDIVVVQGATLQAAIWNGETLSNPLLNGISIADVTPLSLSTKTTQEVNMSGEAPRNKMPMIGGYSIRKVMNVSEGTITFRNLIPRNTEIPTERTQGYTSSINSRRRYYFVVHEGEEEMMENNNLVGYFIFEMGEPNITVSFAVDDDGILNVTAAEDESHRHLARRAEQESKRQMLEAKAKVWLYVNKHLRRALEDAEGWLKNNELPEVTVSELKLDELQRTYLLILHDAGANLIDYQKKLDDRTRDMM
ncbi:hypothetical protein MKW98_009636 [Papaver atlanticum]|uniref:Uncharacterized protein n=1 Tax=Papaver atlanticum TaxID=357466 RepID=A0AAD4SDV4_9MAGN|nr:hypothetical protein MKW98_009636 [Papaver atlanticum]